MGESSNAEKKQQLVALLEELKHNSPTEHLYNLQQLKEFERAVAAVEELFAHAYARIVDIEQKHLSFIIG
jgi:hypothetical protein